jgi:glycosyltransferase involved in cell wall biosynthesis
MPLTIGVVIPCYKLHIPHLGRVLWSINNQTLLPDMVVVSCSSSEDSDILYRDGDYKFPLKIYTHKECRNAAQNRNFGSQQITTDIISYFDADDVMHPQRIESIYKCFILHPNTKLVIHSCILTPSNLIFPKYDINDIDFECDTLHVINNWGSIEHKHDKILRITNGHCSIPKFIFSEIQYIEGPSGHGREDTLFNGSIIKKYSNDVYYCKNDLTWYFQNKL